MAVDKPRDRPGPDGTETTPLLRPSGAADGYGSSTVDSSSVTVAGDDDMTSGSTIVTAESGRSGVNGGEQAVDAREGLPAMANKMHFLLPAIGIGIFLSALDQTLIVATYAKMSSDLEALNRTSWISTA